MEILSTTKIDPTTARVARVFVPSFEDPIDGVLPAEEAEMVVAEGKGKFTGVTMVQIGHMSRETRAPIGFIYRQPSLYQGFRRGVDVCIDPSNLREGVITSVSQEKGLWVRLEGVGNIVNPSAFPV